MKQVLIVDDEKIISASLQRVLIKRGHQVLVANNGLEAIQRINEAPSLDFLFIDLLMPEIGGGEVLDYAKKKFPRAKIFMMTAYGDISVREDLISRGAVTVLAKPFDDILSIPDLLE